MLTRDYTGSEKRRRYAAQARSHPSVGQSLDPGLHGSRPLLGPPPHHRHRRTSIPTAERPFRRRQSRQPPHPGREQPRRREVPRSRHRAGDDAVAAASGWQRSVSGPCCPGRPSATAEKALQRPWNGSPLVGPSVNTALREKITQRSAVVIPLDRAHATPHTRVARRLGQPRQPERGKQTRPGPGRGGIARLRRQLRDKQHERQRLPDEVDCPRSSRPCSRMKVTRSQPGADGRHDEARLNAPGIPPAPCRGTKARGSFRIQGVCESWGLP
ncbi:hypothetical protein M2161_000952 [Streptomyces sp. SAI-133]|nr:hypothetical protein [Streptomyces sp. SAI-133]